MNKKLLVLLPIAMLALAGCNQDGQGGGGQGGGGEGGGGTPTPVPAPEPTGEVLEFDFSELTDIPAQGHTTWIDGYDDGVVGFFTSTLKSGDIEKLSDGTTRTVCVGNGSSGAFENQSGFLKFGNSSNGGKLELTFTQPVFKVTVKDHDWYKKDASHATNKNGIKVNEQAKLAGYNEEAEFVDVVYTLEEPAETVTIESYYSGGDGGRVFVQGLTFEF